MDNEAGKQSLMVSTKQESLVSPLRIVRCQPTRGGMYMNIGVFRTHDTRSCVSVTVVPCYVRKLVICIV